MRQTLKNQVENLLDTGSGSYADVIVQFKSESDKQLQRMLEVVVETERNRSMLVDPSQILPPEARAFAPEKPVRRLLRANATSFSANLALEKLLSKAAADRITAKTDYLDVFLQSTGVRTAVDDAKTRLKSRADEANPQALRNIGGARIMVKRADLTGVIAEQEEMIEGVYENVRIKTPRVVEAASDQTSEQNAYDGTTWGLEQTKALSAWSVFGTRGARPDGTPVRVAVLDTGVDATHPDLQGKIADFAEFDGAGAIVAQGVQAARDSGSHGTHVTGTIIGGDASGGWIGMAPDAEAICGLVLNGDQGGTLAQVIGGIDWAVSEGAQIINLSLGGLTFEAAVGTPYQRAIVDALVRGALVVAAIGNDGHQTSGSPGNDYFALAAAAHDDLVRSAGFSGGRTHVLSQSDYINPQFLPLVYIKPDLSAPGVRVKSSVPDADWASFNGTSMATPHISGAAALLFAATGIADRPAEQRAFLARDLLIGGVTDRGESGQDQRYGYGCLNVLRSIDAAIQRGF
ncbi:MAG: S8 family serine peptidase [Pseudomonadota bacterium]